MVESRLSRSPFMNFSFTWWNFGYHKALSRNFFFTMEIWLSRSLFTIFSFTWWNLGYHEALSRIFLSHCVVHKMHELVEDSFYIYHKEYLHRTRLVKNLASWFRAPFVRKRVWFSLF
jgi:hypothetical protein